MTRVRGASEQTKRLLAAMIEAPTKGHYGYDLARATGLHSGTLYPILIRLAEHGVLVAEWRPSEQPNRPARHVYRLTSRGLVLAREMRRAPADHRLVTAKVAP